AASTSSSSSTTWMSFSELPTTSPCWRKARSWRPANRRKSPAMNASVRPISAARRMKISWRRPRMLSLRDVHVHIGKLHILQGVNLEVKAGESAALLGRNGVGKTTTLRAIMRLVSKTGGTIQFDGFDLSNYPAHEIAGKGIGYVPQGRGIFPGLSVLENLNIAVKGKRDRDLEDYVFGCFPRLKARLQQPGNTLSGGEQQMLA